MARILRTTACVVLCLSQIFCGGGDGTSQVPEATAVAMTIVVQAPAQATTPFIRTLSISTERYDEIARVSYSIAAKPGTLSAPVSVDYSKDYLDQKSYYDPDSQMLRLPVFGLYADYTNTVTLTTAFQDGSSRTDQVEVTTEAYADPTGIYGSPRINVARTDKTQLGFSFFLVKSALGAPVILDTDGNIRWTVNGIVDATSSTFYDDNFLVGSPSSPKLQRIGLDGTVSTATISDAKFTSFHHDLVPGKSGLLAEMNVSENGVVKIESVLAEIDVNGNVLKQWDLGAILTQVMSAGGDDPTNFIRDGADWFHMNSAIYDSADDTLLISSRENFVAKLDYETGALKWLLGDTTKHWYVDYPSLQHYAITVAEGKVPIGQHALSIASDGNLMLFNNGLASNNNPPGTAAGQNRNFSAASRYTIDPSSMSAKEIWTFEDKENIYSDICSSVFEGGVQTYLLNYAVANSRTTAILMGIDAVGDIAFDFEFPTAICMTSWNARPIAFEHLLFD